MNFRRALESEASALSELAFVSKSHWSYSPKQLEAWREDLTITPSTLSSMPAYVAEIETEIVGFFVLYPEVQDWKLEHFWVVPASMGKGVGKAMLSYAVEIASQAGATSLLIDSDPNAEKFYLACGAVRVGSLSAAIEGQPQRELPKLVLHIQPPNPSIERTSPGKPGAASHLKR